MEKRAPKSISRDDEIPLTDHLTSASKKLLDDDYGEEQPRSESLEAQVNHEGSITRAGDNDATSDTQVTGPNSLANYLKPMPVASQQQKFFRFMDLPRELRDEVYDHVLYHDAPKPKALFEEGGDREAHRDREALEASLPKCSFHHNSDGFLLHQARIAYVHDIFPTWLGHFELAYQPSLLFASKRIRDEAMPRYYSLKRIVVYRDFLRSDRGSGASYAPLLRQVCFNPVNSSRLCTVFGELDKSRRNILITPIWDGTKHETRKIEELSSECAEVVAGKLQHSPDYLLDGKDLLAACKAICEDLLARMELLPSEEAFCRVRRPR